MKLRYNVLALLLAAGALMAQNPPAPAEVILHNFSSPPKGANSFSTLVRDASGDFYGTAGSGGTHRAGVVFKLSPGGTETTLYNFTGLSDGAAPLAGAILDSAGNLYGAASGGGTANAGVVYKDRGAGR